MRMLVLFLICLVATPAFAGNTKGKKLIEYGWDCPNTEYVRKNIAEMEKVPFDGVVIQVMSGTGHPAASPSLGWQVFTKEKINPEDCAQAIADLKATKFKKLTDNFIQVISMPGDIDWFDPGWDSVAHNTAMLARVAKQGGCKGIMFDPEEYGQYPIWSYHRMTAEMKVKHTYEEYAAKVRDRGREFIRAINKEFPDITILALFGPSLTYLGQLKNPVSEVNCSLLAAFYDGVCEAATSKTILVDGYEMSYGFRTEYKFAEGRQFMLDSYKMFTNKEAFKKHVRVGFGVWADRNSLELGWHPDDFSKNYFTPAALRESLNYALGQSDGYVWVYSERFSWWGGTAPKEFVEALRLCKTGSK